MTSDSIEELLRSSSKKIASQIAKKTKEKQSLEEQLHEYENSITRLEAKSEVHRERKEELHNKLATMKDKKNNLYSKRDQLIAEKRSFQDELYQTDAGDDSPLADKIESLSEEIGAIIEESKALTEKMQQIYEEAQEENEEMVETREKLNETKYESKNKILSYKRKISEIDRELNNLRRKMRSISDKLEKDTS